MNSKRPIIYGEVLFDCFPDGSSVLGGAPFNVAWHLQGLGFAPLLITGIGRDALGEKVLSAMRRWGMDIAGVQVLDEYPTGQVVVTFSAAGEPQYEIVANQAYDHVQPEPALTLLKSIQGGLIYHGSLIVRTVHSQHMLTALLSETRLPAFVDINLRSPWYQRDAVLDMLDRARWAKMNDIELAEMGAMDTASSTQLIAVAKKVLSKRGMDRLIITRGAQGAVCVTQREIYSGQPVPAQKLIDTVGAGDSFSAVMIAGILRDWPIEMALQRALQFASTVCEMRGATSTDVSLYEGFLNQWG